MVSLEVGGGENVPVIPGTCATRNFAYLVRGPLASVKRATSILGDNSKITSSYMENHIIPSTFRNRNMYYNNARILIVIRTQMNCYYPLNYVHRFFIHSDPTLGWLSPIIGTRPVVMGFRFLSDRSVTCNIICSGLLFHFAVIPHWNSTLIRWTALFISFIFVFNLHVYIYMFLTHICVNMRHSSSMS